MIKAEIVADSQNEFGNRITTMVVTFPRFILAELNTHRMFSRNSASSRAIPFKKMVESVKNNPFIPIAWQKDHSGMQGVEYFTENMNTIPFNTINGQEIYANKPLEDITHKWLKLRDKAVEASFELNSIGVTKQLCNRILEPFMWHTVIITATEWENFFALRCPRYLDNTTGDTSNGVWRSKKDYCNHFNIKENYQTTVQWLGHNKGQAEIHMMALAEAMWDAMNESTPKKLKAGEWHIPFGDNIDSTTLDGISFTLQNGESIFVKTENIENFEVKIATARCARVSYTVVGEEGKEANYENDIKLHDNLAKSGHWSPFEHCAKAMNYKEYDTHISGVVNDRREVKDLTRDEASRVCGWSGNFRGFIQYRKMFDNENIII